MDRNRPVAWAILIAGALLTASCSSLSSLQHTPSVAPDGPSPPVPVSLLTAATPAPVVPSAPQTKHAPSDDPILAEAQALLREAKHHVQEGDDDAAMPFLIRIRALILSDGAAPAPDSLARREEILENVESLLDEIITMRGIAAAIPLEREAPIVSPDDVAVLEKATPRMPMVEKPEITYDVPIEINSEVQAYIELFTTEKRELIAEALERSGRYLPMMRQIFADKGLPQDLVNLAYIESAFKLYAYSRARAMGIWQFMQGTGRKYGLKRNWWVDERRDPVKATMAAAAYLSDLYTLFESWPLAIAAYNAGEGKVLKAIRRQKSTEVWKLKLPRETKFYVPAFMAMTIISKDPEAYGFTRPAERAWEVDQVALAGPTDLRLLAKAADVSVEELRDLNPELRRLATPPEEGYVLNLPAGTQATLHEALAQLPVVRQVGWQQRKVQPGETLSIIAQRYRTTVATLMEMNRLESPHRIRAGTYITVPVPVSALALAEPSQASARTDGTDASHYVVQHGDTLWDIARAHQVSTHDLQRWNNLHDSRIHPGHTLRIHVASSEVARVERAEHRIRRGETLSTIAERYGTTVPTLMELNQLASPDEIRAGTRIAVPVPDGNAHP